MGGVRSPVLFIGETLVDLICEHPVSDWSQADAFVPHCGGAPTNAAIVAARCGAAVALGGGVGDDQWGRWLETRLLAEQIDLRWWARLPGVQTAVAFVAIDEQAVPDFVIYGQGIEPALLALASRLDEAVGACAAVELGSNTCVGEQERAVSEQARELALRGGKPVDRGREPSPSPLAGHRGRSRGRASRVYGRVPRQGERRGGAPAHGRDGAGPCGRALCVLPRRSSRRGHARRGRGAAARRRPRGRGRRTRPGRRHDRGRGCGHRRARRGARRRRASTRRRRRRRSRAPSQWQPRSTEAYGAVEALPNSL